MTHQDPSSPDKAPRTPSLAPALPPLRKPRTMIPSLTKEDSWKEKESVWLEGTILNFKEGRGSLHSHQIALLPFPNQEPTSTPAAASSQRIDSILPRPGKYQSLGLAAMTPGSGFPKGPKKMFKEQTNTHLTECTCL